jgi:RimJ/RimL family protein N-acetyltransferase
MGGPGLTGPSNLVPLERQLLTSIRGWLLDADLRLHLGTLAAPSDAQQDRWYEAVAADPRRHVQVITDVEDGTPSGVAGLDSIDLVYRRAEVWLYVIDGAAKGTGAAALHGLLAHAFETLGIHRVSARVFAFNERAARFFQKHGFVAEGVERDGVYKGGAFHDVLLFSILEDDFRRR